MGLYVNALVFEQSSDKVDGLRLLAVVLVSDETLVISASCPTRKQTIEKFHCW